MTFANSSSGNICGIKLGIAEVLFLCLLDHFHLDILPLVFHHFRFGCGSWLLIDFSLNWEEAWSIKSPYGKNKSITWWANFSGDLICLFGTFYWRIRLNFRQRIVSAEIINLIFWVRTLFMVIINQIIIQFIWLIFHVKISCFSSLLNLESSGFAVIVFSVK